MRKPFNLFVIVIILSLILEIAVSCNTVRNSEEPLEAIVTSIEDNPKKEILPEFSIPYDYFEAPVYQYTSTKYAFAVSYPQTWTFEENVYQECIDGYGVQFTSERSLIDIFIVAGNIDGTLEEITNNFVVNTKKNIPTTWKVARYTTSIKSPKTYMIQLDGQVSSQDMMVDFCDVSFWFFHENTLYFIRYMAFGPLCKSREYLGCLYAMLGSFRFIGN